MAPKMLKKKSPKYLEIAIKCPYLCTRFERETPLESDKNYSETQKQVLKNFEKSSEIFWRFRKMTYLCTRFE